jgi:hypothetical protein
MNSPDIYVPRSIDTETATKANSWLDAVKRSLQSEADKTSIISSLASLDLNSSETDRPLVEGKMDDKSERFFTTLESMAWSEHMLTALATLEDRRTAFMHDNGHDIAREQFVALQTFLDHPGFHA